MSSAPQGPPRPQLAPIELSAEVRKHLETVDAGGGPNQGRLWRIKGWERMTMPQRLAFLRLYVEDVARDPAIAELAGKIVMAAGAASRDHAAQWKALLKWVQTHIYYANEPKEQFRSPQYSISTGGPADCLPASTLLRVRGRGDVPISTVQPGEEIWGKDDWTTVEAIVEKGFLPVSLVEVTNTVTGQSSKFHATRDHKVYALKFVDGRLTEVRVCVHELDRDDILIGPFKATFRVGLRAGPDAYPRCFDIQTSDHYVFLPECGVTVSNCDDCGIVLASLGHSLRLPWKWTVSGLSRSRHKVRWIEGVGRAPTGVDWSHIYLAVGWPPFRPKAWTFADPSLDKPLGWDAVGRSMEGVGGRGVNVPTDELPEMSGVMAGDMADRVVGFARQIPWPAVAGALLAGVMSYEYGAYRRKGAR